MQSSGLDTLSDRDRRVLTRIAQRAHITRDIDVDFEKRLRPDFVPHRPVDRDVRPHCCDKLLAFF